jgi:hypothetical protein
MSPMPQARTAGDVDVLEHSLVAAKMSVLRDKTSAPAKRSDDGAFRCYRRRPKWCRAALAAALQKFSEWPLPHAGPLCYRALHSRGTVATSQ